VRLWIDTDIGTNVGPSSHAARSPAVGYRRYRTECLQRSVVTKRRYTPSGDHKTFGGGHADVPIQQGQSCDVEVLLPVAACGDGWAVARAVARVRPQHGAEEDQGGHDENAHDRHHHARSRGELPTAVVVRFHISIFAALRRSASELDQISARIGLMAIPVTRW